MSKASKVLFIAAGVLGAIMLLVIVYVWIGAQVFGINTSRLDPSQGPSWPMEVVVWSLIGAVIAAAAGLSLTIASRRASTNRGLSLSEPH